MGNFLCIAGRSKMNRPLSLKNLGKESFSSVSFALNGRIFFLFPSRKIWLSWGNLCWQISCNSYHSRLNKIILPEHLALLRQDHKEYIYLAGFLITLSPNRPLAFNSFFFIIKTKSATIAFFFFSSFPSPSSFFSSFPFPSLLWFWSFSGLRNLLLDAFSLKWLQIS